MTTGERGPLRVRAAMGDRDLAALASIIGEASPERPTTLEELRWEDTAYPGSTRLLVERGGIPVGAGTVGRIYMYAPDHPDAWATIDVLPGARRQGAGEHLLRALSDAAGVMGKHGLHIPGSADRPDALAFLRKRGFREYERSKTVRLELAGRERPTDHPTPGIRIVSIAAEPDRVTGVHAVAVEAFRDVPHGDRPMDAGDLEEFRMRDVDRPAIPHDAFMVAVDAASDEVVGYAVLALMPGSTKRAYHDMTAVLRAYRGRGIATQLKHATIAWAIDHGLHSLETGNDEANVAMRTVNARLGYQPLPDEVTMRGPLFGGIMGS